MRAPFRLLLLLFVFACSGCEDRKETTPGTSPITFLSGEGREGFARVEGPRAFELPRDHGAHEDYQIEWWYFTGNMDDAERRRFGFELTFFRIGLAGDDPATRASAWATDQLYMAHFAVTDVAGEEFHAFERLTRGSLELAGCRDVPLKVWNEDWRLETESVGRDPFPMRLIAAERAGGETVVGIDLVLTAEKPLVLQGERGFSRKGPEPGNASYYLQYPRLGTTGTVTLAGEEFDVTGQSWMDHEWSTSVLGPELAGWDWFALQLEDGRDVMVYQLRRHDGAASGSSKGSIVAADGSVTALALDDFSLQITDHWTSPHTGARYPAAWRLAIPSAGLDVTIEPVLADQELRLSTSYWEGAVDVSGSDVGRGYVELVGY